MDHKWGKSAWLGDCREHRTNPVHAMTPDVWGKARSSPTGVVDVLPRLVVSLQRRRPADTAEGQRDPGLVRQVRLPGDCPNRRPIECLLGRGLGTRADGVVCAKEVARCRIAFEPTPSGLRRDRDRTPGSRRCASATRGYGSQALQAWCRWRSIPGRPVWAGDGTGVLACCQPAKARRTAQRQLAGGSVPRSKDDRFEHDVPRSLDDVGRLWVTALCGVRTREVICTEESMKANRHA
jgi:hypothetical protein